MSENEGSPGTGIESRRNTEVTPAEPPAAVEELSALAKAALAAGMPDETLRAFKSRCKDFEVWCARAGRSSLPATSNTVTEYVTWLCYGYVSEDGVRGRSLAWISQARWAISKAHEVAGIDPPPAKQAVIVVKGYKAELARNRDRRAKPQPTTAITRDSLRELAESQDTSTLSGLRDRAMVLLSYSAATRVSELVSINIEDITGMPDGLLISVYRGKTRRHDEVAIPDAYAPLAVEAINEWRTALAEAGRTTGPLFVRIDKHGHVGAPAYRTHRKREGEPDGDADGRMSPNAAERCLKRAKQLAGLSGRITGHSMRRGFATQARRAGHDQIRIARHGGWDDNSTALSRYMEDADKWTDNPLKGAGL